MSVNLGSIAIIYIHGIAVDEPGYSKELHANIHHRLLSADCWDHVVPGEVFWGDLFAGSSGRLRKLMDTMDLSWTSVRRMTLDTVAQALGYDDAPGHGAYEEVHERVVNTIRKASVQLGRPARMFLVAHSLGSIVASNYVWDSQHSSGIFRGRSWEAAPRLDNWKGLITMGSPLALSCCRYADFGTPIAAASKGVTWMNLVADSDPLAWPLRGLNPRYEAEVTQDLILRPRWWQLSQRTPVSHTGYWTSKAVAETIGDMILSVIRPKESK